MNGGTAPPGNRLELTASIIERTLLRYSPAGIPICQCILEHRSTQVEAQHPRQIELQFAAVGMGEVAVRLDRILLGQAHHFTGFLAQTRRNSRNVIYHITEFNLVIED